MATMKLFSDLYHGQTYPVYGAGNEIMILILAVLMCFYGHLSTLFSFVIRLIHL